MLPTGKSIELSFEACLIRREVRCENIGDIQVLGLHLQPAGSRGNVMNMDVAAVPALLASVRPSRESDLHHTVADIFGVDFTFADDVLISFDCSVSNRKLICIEPEFAVRIGKLQGLEVHIAL